MTTPYYATNQVTLHLGDSLDILPTLPDTSIDAIVTDPPYELGFMGRAWDASGIAYNVALWRQCMRVLKPGGHLAAFGGTRTYHRLACAIEDAGFEVRDSLHWIYGSGFPKSLSVHKATLKSIESRYAEACCNCVDARNGSPVGHDAGQGGSRPVRARRGTGEVPATEARDTAIQGEAGPGEGAMRQLRNGSGAEAPGRSAIGSPVLLADVCGCGSEETGLGDASVWAGVEEHPGEGTEAGQGVSVLRDSAHGGRCPACASSEAVQVRRHEPVEQSGLSVRRVPPHGGSGDDVCTVVDPGRREPRRLHLDDRGGRRPAVAWVCSWCALPDRGWLDSLIPLGSALKPAHEPIVLARKPLTGTVAGNVLAHGTGALNIDSCRTPLNGEPQPTGSGDRRGTATYAQDEWTRTQMRNGGNVTPEAGRWPSNVVLSHPPLVDEYGQPIGDACADGCIEGCPVAEMDRQSGFSVSPAHNTTSVTQARSGQSAKGSEHQRLGKVGHGDQGGASRFFPVFRYEAKAPARERPRLSDGTAHPTVKPLALLRWLVRLVTPPGGTVLEPFAGSGTTLEAAALEGFNVVGVERDEQHAELCRVRLSKPLPTALFGDIA